MQSWVPAVGSEAVADTEQGGYSFPSRSISKLKTPTDGSGLRMWQRGETTWVVSGASQEPWKGGGSAELVSSDRGICSERETIK